MACRRSGDKPLSEPMLEIVNWNPGKKLQWNFNRNWNIFIQEKALENVVCEMASILSRPQCVTMFLPIAAEFLRLPNDESFFKTCLHHPCTCSYHIGYLAHFVYGMCNGSYPWKDCGLDINCESDEVVEQLKTHCSPVAPYGVIDLGQRFR